MTEVLEGLTEEEACLFAILTDPSGAEIAEFAFIDEEQPDAIFRLWSFQWSWWRNETSHQVDQGGRSVGKTKSIVARACAMAFAHLGQEMVIVAPELNFLTPLTDNIESQMRAVRFLEAMVVKGRSGVTHRPFHMTFVHGGRIMGRIPQRDGRGVKGIHPKVLEVDEAQNLPDPAWAELIETVKRGGEFFWRVHGVTRGVDDEFKRITTPTPGSPWTVHKLPAVMRPTWTHEEREEKFEQYPGGRENPDFKRNVYGWHGDPTSPCFPLDVLMSRVDVDEGSDYNTSEYYSVKMIGEELEAGGRTLEMILDFPPGHRSYRESGRAEYWIGFDVGFTADPSEMVVFVEHTPKRGADSELKMLARVQMKRVGARHQLQAMLMAIDHYRPKGFGIDKNGPGYAMYEMLQDFTRNPDKAPEWAQQYDLKSALNTIQGYSFGDQMVVDLDLKEGAEGEEIKRNVKEVSTDTLRGLMDTKRFLLPWDTEVIGQFQGSTWSPIKGYDSYGRRRYSTGNDHVLDASRNMALAWLQDQIDKRVVVPKRRPTPTIAMQT